MAQCAAWMADPRSGISRLSQPEQAQWVRRAWQEPLPRLLVFDNCEDPALFEKWRPKAGGCRVLLTSRRGRWSPGQGVQTVPVGVLPRRESVTLLTKFAPAPTVAGWQDELLDQIAAELGDLPLALHLAGSYLAQVAYDMTPHHYLQELRRPDLLDHVSLTEGDLLPTGHEVHVARTFALSYGQLNSETEVDASALHLLACAACFAPGEPLPRPLLRDAAGLAAEETAGLAATAVRRLVNLGLVEEEAGGSLRLHRLLHRYVAGTLASEQLATALAAVETSVLALANRQNSAGDPRPLLVWQVHLRHVTEHAQAHKDERAAALCNTVGYHLHMVGDYTAARPLFEQALAIRRQVLGEGHPDTASSLNNLGSLLQDMGELAAAKPYYEQALAIRRQVLGEGHPDTARSLNNLGSLLKAQGELAAAKPYYEQALAITRQVLGEGHPDTASSLNNLGSLLQAQGELAAAKPYYEQALAIRRQVLGEGHPDTARSLNNLGYLLQAQGELAAAKPYYEQALAIRRQVLGEGHPDTARSLNNLGYLLKAQGELAAAKPYYEQALAIRRQVLGEGHPDTAQSLNNLGSLLQAQGELAAAKPYYEQALAIYRQVLGEGHPDTAQSLNNLGYLLQAQGELAAAKPYYEQALAIYRQVLGEGHPDTASSLNNLGYLLKAQGELAAAKPYYEQALAIRRQVLGEGHPDTAQSLNNLGILAYYEGYKQTAQIYLEQALAIYEARLGADHPDTQTTRQSLAVVRSELAQVAREGSATAEQAADSSLADLLNLVIQAREGDEQLRTQLLPVMEALEGNSEAPAIVQSFAHVLLQVLAGDDDPDLAALPPDLAAAVQKMLEQLRK